MNFGPPWGKIRDSMLEWLDFGTCFEVDEPHIESALAPAATVADELPRAKVFALLDRMAEIARPRQGAPRILFVVARLTSCDWVEGELEVRLQARGNDTVIDLMVHDGMLRSHLRPSLVVRVPFQEFEVALGRIADFIAPLQVFELVEGREASLGVDAELVAVDASETDRAERSSPVEPGALGVRASRLHSVASKTSQQGLLRGAAKKNWPTGSQYPQEPALSTAVVGPNKQVAPSSEAAGRRPDRRTQSPKVTIRREVAEIPKRLKRRSDRSAALTNEPVPPRLDAPPVPREPPSPQRAPARRRPDPKSTIRMEAVKIPEEAYRPEQRQSVVDPAEAAATAPAADKPTVRPPPDALPAEIWAEEPGLKPDVTAEDRGPEPGPDTGDVDESW